MDKWEKILMPIDKNKRFWILCVTISGVILVIATGVNTWNGNEQKSNILISYICDFTIALTTAIWSTFALNIIYNLSETRRISVISRVAYENLLPDLLCSLEKFAGRYRKDESISVKVCKFSDITKSEFYKVVFEYQYITNLQKLKQLQFTFCRIFDDNVNDFTGGLNYKHMSCEFIWGVDEQGFPPNVIEESDYRISQLFVGGNSVTDIEKYRVLSFDENNTIISYSIPIDKLNNSRSDSQVQLSYKVELPLEKEDLLLVTHELPTKNSKITFDFSEIGGEVNVYGFPMTGTIAPLSPKQNGESRITYLISGWILPKQGYVFGWWKK